MANHGPVYGLDAELAAKRAASYDPKLEADAKSFIQSVTGDNVSNVHEDLKDGIILCNLMNRIAPGKVAKIGKVKAPFVMMENINAYLQACRSIGIQTHDLFQTVDLFEAKNMSQVVLNIMALKRYKEGKYRT